MDAAVLVYMKEGKTYEEWEELMLNLYDNKNEVANGKIVYGKANDCLLYTSPSPRDDR